MDVGTKRANPMNYQWSGPSEMSNPKKQQIDPKRIRLLVLGEYAGMMIGRAGENMKRLRYKYNVTMHGLGQNKGGEVMVLDVVGERHAALEAIGELLPTCPQSWFASGKEKRFHEVNVLVDTNIVGILIGKGGSRYKEISAEIGMQFKIYPDVLPGSDERVLSFGDNNIPVIINGLAKCLSVLDTANAADRETKLFDPSTQKLPPRVMAQSEQKFNNPSQQMPHPSQFQNPEFQNRFQNQFPNQLQNQNQFPNQLQNQNQLLNQSQNQQLQNPLGQNLSVNPALNNIAKLLVDQRNMKTSSGRDTSRDFGFVKTKTTLKICHGLCGIIIGAGGKNINYIKEMSGAGIEMSKPEGNGKEQERTVTMTGTQYQIQIAEQLMASCIRMSNSKREMESQQ